MGNAGASACIQAAGQRVAAMPVAELTYKRATMNLSDAARLGEGEDLNDATLDFFVKLGQALIPKGGEEQTPVAYLGSLFFKQLTSAFATSGEEGWKHVMNWAKRKANGMFNSKYAAFSVPINEDLKDEKGEPAGNHWWLALVINPPGGARGESTSVMCLDSMQRREKAFVPTLGASYAGSSSRYSVEVTKVEQAGYLLIISFDARGDGSAGPLHRPERSVLRVQGFECRNPELGLRINMGGGDGASGRLDGTLTFALDGRIRSSSFELNYAGEGYQKIKFEFDPFQLTKLQKNVTRFLGGYLAKEWEMNGPNKKMRFEKQSARALVADVHQQENLNDCGVFVLENTLRSLNMKPEFLRSMAEASAAVLQTFPWPTQEDITTRKLKLKAIVARLFEEAAAKGSADVESLLKGNDALRNEVLRSLTDDRESEIDKWADQLGKSLGARQADKDEAAEAQKAHDSAVQARRDEERRAKEEEEERKKVEEREQGKMEKRKQKRPHQQLKKSESESEASPSRGQKKAKAPDKKKKAPARRRSDSGSSDGSASPPPAKGNKVAKGGKRASVKSGRSESDEPRRKRDSGGRNGRKRNRSPSDEESASESRDRRPKRRR